MPAAKAKAKAQVIEVILPDSTPKKNSVRFETGERPVDLTNIYLSKEGLAKLGNPSGVKVTIEAYEGE